MSAANTSGFQADPSQAAVIDCREHLCVMAGAGSGKTGTLVEALTRRLAESAGEESPLEITDVLALTFTEKAAAELRMRLGRSFRRRRKSAAGQREAEFWRRQESRLDRADIGTIHSYALKLIRENPLKLGLSSPPALDDRPGGLRVDLEGLIIDLLDQNDPDLLSLLPRYHRYALTAMLEKCLTRLSSWGLGGLRAELTPPSADFAARVDHLRGLAREALTFVTTGGLDPAKNYYERVRLALSGLNQALEPPTEELLPDLTANLRRWALLLKSGGDWYVKPGRARRKELQAALDEMWQLTADIAAVEIKKRFLALTEKADQLLAAEKKRRGLITFDDSLILARRLLAENPDLRGREAARHRLVVVDEFQDTNRLQADLLAYLLLPPDDDKVYRPDHPVRLNLNWAAAAGRFSVFGDLKQSIYRFRGAEVSIMSGLKNELAQGAGKALALSGNYRSQAPLTEFYNALFAGRLEGFTPDDLQTPCRPALYQGPQAAIVRGPEDQRPPRGRAGAEAQARLLTLYLADLFSGRLGITVGDEKGEARTPRPGDVAVLFRRFKWAGVFKDALVEAGWPCRLAVGDNPFDYAEVKGLTAALQYLYGVDRELSLAALLRSPLGPVSDEGLTLLAWPGDSSAPRPLSSYFGPEAEWPPGLSAYDQKTLTEIAGLLAALRPMVGRVRPVEILERLVEDRSLLALAVSEPDGRERIRAVTLFLAQSRTLGRDRQSGPAGAIDELRDLKARWDPRNKPGEADPGLSAINLMTVHASKGLEFPVVVLAESDAPLRFHPEPVVISDDGRLALRFKNEFDEMMKPSDFLALEAEEKALDIRENVRLFYVAATRARDHLVFLGWPKPEKKGAAAPDESTETVWLEMLKRSDAASLCLEEEYSDQPAEAAPPALSAEEDFAPGPEPGGPLLTEPVKLGPRNFSVTALSRLLADPEAYSREAILGLDRDFSWSPGEPFFKESETPAEAGPGRSLRPDEAGNLFHAVMENLDPLAPDPAGLLAAQAVRLGLEPAEAELDDLNKRLEIFLDQPIGRLWRESRALGCPDYRELPFQLRLPLADGRNGLALTGTIDLIFVDKNGRGCIVDYKLARMHPGPELAAYENQLRIYAQAIISSGWLTKLCASIYFAGGPEPVTHPVPLDLAAPLKELWPEICQKIYLCENTRPLRPAYPGALNIVYFRLT